MLEVVPMEWDTEAAEKHVELRNELRERMEVELMQPYVPGAMWSKIMGGDAKWITSNSLTRDITVSARKQGSVGAEARRGVKRSLEG